MRRILVASLFVSFGICAGTAFGQAGVEGTGSIANEGHDVRHEGDKKDVCTAELTDEADKECYEYWENHINWFSWDYKAPYDSPMHRHMPPPFGFALMNFLVFAAIMYKLAARPLQEFVQNRHLTIKKDLDEAAALHREAEARLRDYESKIQGLDAEIQSLLTQVRSEAQTEKARIVAGAEAQAEQLQKDAQAQIAAEVSRVRRELKAEAVNAALALAESLVSQKAGEADQVKLTERFVADLEHTSKSPTQSPSPPAVRS